MKRFLANGLGLFVLGILHFNLLLAQPCPDGAQSVFELYLNNIQARFQAGGSLFNHNNDGYFIPNPEPGVGNPSTIFDARLWVGGLDPGGNLKMFAETYNFACPTGPFDPITFSPADCTDWDRFFYVTGDRIAAFLNDLPNLVNHPDSAVIYYPEIMGWPAKNNFYFPIVNGFDLPENTYDLAPFFDKNGDTNYDPLFGDYPALITQGGVPFVPAGIVWNVYNDVGLPWSFPLEIQFTAWVVNCPGEPELNNTIFTSHKIINRGMEDADSLFIGFWVDFDLGCFTDDYIGCNPDLQSFFAYNKDSLDGDSLGNCTFGVLPFAENPPVQSVTFLNRSLSKFTYFNNPAYFNPPPGTTDPNIASEFYYFLTGSWRDGKPLTYGGDGYSYSSESTDFAFPDDPADPQGWSLCSSALPDYDRRIVGSHKAGRLQPGAIDELVAAWTHHPNPDLPCGLGDTYDRIANIRAIYESGFEGVCSPISGILEIPTASAFDLFPNPASKEVTIDAEDQKVLEIAISRIDGRIMTRITSITTATIQVDISGWNPGIYLVQLKTEEGAMSRKLIVN